LPAYIAHHIRIKNGSVTKDGMPVTDRIITAPEDLYRDRGFSYPKFFKMDILCKWAWLATEILLSENDSFLYDGMDKNNIALVLETTEGCIEIDKKYEESIASIPSPALFVYTLPNIMLGEICIRHGFKGEQACIANNVFSSEELTFWANDIMENRKMDACLLGYVNATNDHHDISLFWITKDKNIPLTAQTLQELYNK
jgi:hypothetical protein